MQRVQHLVLTALLLVAASGPWKALAQDDDSDAWKSDVDQIEAEIESKTKKTEAPLAESAEKDKKDTELKDFSALGKLAPFSQISVIQKRFLPKTGRFQLFGGFSTVTNDPWFQSLGFTGKFAYHLTETWGAELTGIFLSTSQRQSAMDLSNQNSVQTSSFISTKNYYGADLLWTPIYGKMTLFNHRIIPFDMYFALGGGSSNVANGTAGGTLHGGVGQIYAINKALGFRWDFSWNSFSGTPNPAVVGAAQPSAQNFNNLILTFGASFFFPEANYR